MTIHGLHGVHAVSLLQEFSKFFPGIDEESNKLAVQELCELREPRED